MKLGTSCAASSAMWGNPDAFAEIYWRAHQSRNAGGDVEPPFHRLEIG